MKLRRLINFGFTSLYMLLSGCGLPANKDEFKWYATESAPSGYPMEIIQGTFFYKGKDTGLYIPNGGVVTHLAV